MEKKSNKFLKVTGILMIIGGGLGIILGIIAVGVVGVAMAIGEASGLTMFGSILVLVSAVVSLIAGIIGVKNASKPEKAQTCIVFGILTAVFAVLGSALSMAGGSSFNFTSFLIGLVLPVLYLIGAYQNKSLVGAVQNKNLAE